MENQPSGKNVCLHETQQKIIYSKEIFRPTANYENSIIPAFRDEDVCKSREPSTVSTPQVHPELSRSGL